MNVISSYADYEAPENDGALILLGGKQKFACDHLTSHLDTVLERYELNSLLERQLELEKSRVVKIPSITRNSMSQMKLKRYRDFSESIDKLERQSIESFNLEN